MLEIMVLALDSEGLPRAYATSLIETNQELEDLKSVAADMLDKYIAGKPYPLDKNDYIFVVEIVD